MTFSLMGATLITIVRAQHVPGIAMRLTLDTTRDAHANHAAEADIAHGTVHALRERAWSTFTTKPDCDARHSA